MAVSGANFGVAETGTVCVVESEGNGRLCTTLPDGARDRDGDREGAARVARPRGDAPAPAALLDRRADEPLHVDLDRRARRRRAARVPPRPARQRAARACSRTRSGRQALHCIRCSACLNVCPVYSRTGGHAYELGLSRADRRDPDAAAAAGSTRADAAVRLRLCGACYEVCPVKIDIPRVLVHLRGRVVREQAGGGRGERAAMPAAGARVRLAPRATRPRSGSRGSGRGPLPGCRSARCADGPRRATCPSRRRRASATGGGERG